MTVATVAISDHVVIFVDSFDSPELMGFPWGSTWFHHVSGRFHPLPPFRVLDLPWIFRRISHHTGVNDADRLDRNLGPGNVNVRIQEGAPNLLGDSDIHH